jgi:hypothetical protein
LIGWPTSPCPQQQIRICRRAFDASGRIVDMRNSFEHALDDHVFASFAIWDPHKIQDVCFVGMG